MNDPNADTEFNDALRAHGILPPKTPTPPSPSTLLPTAAEIQHFHLSSAPADQLLALEEDAQLSDDEELFASYRAKKIQEMKEEEARGRFVANGEELREIGREEFVRLVKEDSEKDLRGEENEGRGRGVVCFLYKDSIPNSQHLRNLLKSLIPHHPLTTFLSIPGASCIPNYPDRNIPTLLFYRKGDCVGQLVGLPKGLKTNLKDVENVLVGYGVAEGESESLRKELARKRDGEEGSDSEDEDREWNTMSLGKRGAERGLRQGGLGLGVGNGNGRGKRKEEDSGSELDM